MLTAIGAAVEIPVVIFDAAAITGSSAATANNFRPRRFMYFIHELAFSCFLSALIRVHQR
jgi:hypothetical protein